MESVLLKENNNQMVKNLVLIGRIADDFANGYMVGRTDESVAMLEFLQMLDRLEAAWWFPIDGESIGYFYNVELCTIAAKMTGLEHLAFIRYLEAVDLLDQYEETLKEYDATTQNAQ